MKIPHKKRLTCWILGISAVISGVEHAVILPSAWSYLQVHFPGTHPVMLGALLAGYSLGALLSGPMGCWWSSVCQNTRAVLLTFNLFSLSGAVFYFAAPSPWALVASRFISGLGFGGQSAIVVDVSKSLTSEGTGRRALFLLHLCRQLGLLLGPAFYLPMESAQYPNSSSTSSIRIDKFSSPGLLLIAVFVLQELLFLGYYNLTRLCEEERLREQLEYSYHRFSSTPGDARLKRTSSLPHQLFSTVFSPTLEVARAMASRNSRSRRGYDVYSEDVVDNFKPVDNTSDVAIESAEHFIMSASLSQSLPHNQHRNGQHRHNCYSKFHSSGTLETPDAGQFTQSDEHISQKSENLMQMTDRLISEPSVYFEPVSRLDRLRAHLQDISDEYLRDDTLVLLTITLICVTLQKIMETIIILVTKDFYTDTERLNCYIFILIGFQLILVALFAQLIRRLVVDTVLLLLGLVLLSAAMLCLLLVLPNLTPDDLGLVSYLVASGVVCFVAAPLLLLCSASLLINITAYDKHIMTQELSQLVMSVGSIVGPLWAGSLWGHPTLLVAGPLGIVLTIMVLYIISFRHMISPTNTEEYQTLRASAGTPRGYKTLAPQNS